MKKHLRKSRESRNVITEAWQSVRWPGESKETGETPYMQRRQRAAMAAGMKLCKCGGLIWDCGRCGDCGQTERE